MNLKTGLKAFLGFAQNNYGMLRCPDLPSEIDHQIIGHSHQGKDILCYKVGTGSYPILFLSAIHGNEVGTVRFAHHLLSWLIDPPEIQRGFSCFVIPCLNPDGYDLARRQPDYRHGGRIGRLNARDVDLNRNFDTASFHN